MNIIIRNETKDDYKKSENLTREAFGMFTAPAAQSTLCSINSESQKIIYRGLALLWKKTAKL